MSEPEPRMVTLLNLITRIEGLLDEEEAALRRLDLSVLEQIRQRKETAAEAYERALRDCRGDPSALAELEAEEREQVAMRMRSFQARMSRNVNIIAALRDASERLLRSLGDHARTAAHAGGRPTDPRASASVVSLTLNENF